MFDSRMELHEVLWPNKYLLTFLGLWPLDPDTKSLKCRIFVYMRIILALTSVIALTLPHFITLFANWGNIEILRDHGALTVIFFLTTLKMFYFLIHRKNYVIMYQYIKEFWDVTKDPVERANYEQLANLAKILTIVSFLSAMSNLMSYQVIALINWFKNYFEINSLQLHRRPLPMELDYGFDTQQSPAYEMMFIYQTICMVYSVCAIIGGDCTMMTLILHVAGQFKLINSRLRVIGQKIEEQSILKDMERELNDEIEKCVVQHQHVIKVTKELDVLLNPLIFSQIFASSLEICLSGYAAIEHNNSNAEIIKFFMLWASMLLQLVVWCFPAELLIKESTAIANTIYYDISWFRLTPRQRRDLSFIIARAQKGSHMTSFYQVVSIKKLTDVFNAAAAYMTILRSIKK